MQEGTFIVIRAVEIPKHIRRLAAARLIYVPKTENAVGVARF
jgi:hypothetical protein